MDDMLRSVIKLDGNTNVKKIERSASFQSGDLKKFQPCSSLENVVEMNSDGDENRMVELPVREAAAENCDPSTPKKSSANLQKAKNLFDQCCSDLQNDDSDPEPPKIKLDSSTEVVSEAPDSETFAPDSSLSKTAGLISTDHSQTNVITEFSTAGGKKISVSEKSLNFASQLLENVGSEDDPSEALKSLKVDYIRKSMFQSASGKATYVSLKNLRKAKNLLDSVDSELLEVTKRDQVKPQSVPQLEAESSDFSTPENAPKKSIDESCCMSIVDTGFCSAKGRNIYVSEKSLNFASNLLENEENKSEPTENSKASSETVNTIPQLSTSSSQNYRKSLFSSASGKTMHISSANLQKAKNLFDQCCSDLQNDDSDPEPPKIKLDSSTEVVSEAPDSETFAPDSSLSKTAGLISTDHSQTNVITEFSTAGGKKISVSEKSLNFASQLLENVGSEDDPSEALKSLKVDHIRKSMFQSASGKATYVSSKNLRKAKNLLDSVDSELLEVTKRDQVKPQSVPQLEAESSDFSTPENALLDNDDDLFQAIETPSKGKTVQDEPARKLMVQNDEFDKSLGQLLSPDDLAVPLVSSPTVFNKSGVNTQRKNYSSSASSPTSRNKHSRSPTLMNKSIIESPRSLRHYVDRKERIISPKSFLFEEKMSRKNTSSKTLLSEDKPILTSAENVSEFRAFFSDLIDEEKNPQLSSVTEDDNELKAAVGKFLGSVPEGNGAALMHQEPKAVDAEMEGHLTFKSAAGISISASQESLKRVQNLVSDLDEEVPLQMGNRDETMQEDPKIPQNNSADKFERVNTPLGPGKSKQS